MKSVNKFRVVQNAISHKLYPAKELLKVAACVGFPHIQNCIDVSCVVTDAVPFDNQSAEFRLRLK